MDGALAPRIVQVKKRKTAMAKIKKIMSTLSQTRWWPLFLVACFLGAIFLFQIMHLVGDPSPLKRIGDIGDEGYWIHNARSRVLFGTSLPDQFNQAYIGATLYNYLLVIIFKIAGVSLFSARFLSLLAFWIILVVFFKLVKKYYGLRVALVSTLLFGITNVQMIFI